MLSSFLARFFATLRRWVAQCSAAREKGYAQYAEEVRLDQRLAQRICGEDAAAQQRVMQHLHPELYPGTSLE